MAVWVTGTGTITCVGPDVSSLWRAAESGLSGLEGGLGFVSEATLNHARQTFLKNPNFKNVQLPPGRSKEFSLLAIEQAMRAAGWQTLNPDDGLILATTTGQIPLWDRALTSYLQKTLSKEEFTSAFQHNPLGDLLASVTKRLGFEGRQMLLASACSASTQAFGLAAMWLKEGLVKRCLVGGIEVLCDLTTNGFSSLQLLSREAPKPFDANRTGINLSEGAAFFCLENEPGANPQARLSGYAMTSDGYHMTAPHPEGKGCYEAMSRALKSADLPKEQISWIHAHGTGSHHNDFAEAVALRALYPDAMPFVSSSKWVHGHALGASGAIESVLCVEALKRQTILKTYGLENIDETLALNHPRENTKTQIRHILKNTLGFGGTNAALVWSAP